MAINIEMNLKKDDGNYEVMYPKADYSNINGTLNIENTTGSLSITDRIDGNLPANRLSAGTLSGNFTFSTPPYCSISPSGNYYLANKAYVDSLNKQKTLKVTSMSMEYTGNGDLKQDISLTGIDNKIIIGTYCGSMDYVTIDSIQGIAECRQFLSEGINTFQHKSDGVYSFCQGTFKVMNNTTARGSFNFNVNGIEYDVIIYLGEIVDI